MPLGRVPYRSVEALLQRELAEEDPATAAILTLIDPRRYGVLDVRAWQLLFGLGSVGRKPAGRGFATRDWLEYLGELRRHARRLGVTARAVEYTLFQCHRRFQKGQL